MTEFLPGSGLEDVPWEEKGDPELNLAHKAKRSGMSAREYVENRTIGIRLTARVLKWDSGTVDQAVLALTAIVAEVWGPKQ